MGGFGPHSLVLWAITGSLLRRLLMVLMRSYMIPRISTTVSVAVAACKADALLLNCLFVTYFVCLFVFRPYLAVNRGYSYLCSGITLWCWGSNQGQLHARKCLNSCTILHFQCFYFFKALLPWCYVIFYGRSVSKCFIKLTSIKLLI